MNFEKVPTNYSSTVLQTILIGIFSKFILPLKVNISDLNFDI